MENCGVKKGQKSKTDENATPHPSIGAPRQEQRVPPKFDKNQSQKTSHCCLTPTTARKLPSRDKFICISLRHTQKTKTPKDCLQKTRFLSYLITVSNFPPLLHNINPIVPRRNIFVSHSKPKTFHSWTVHKGKERSKQSEQHGQVKQGFCSRMCLVNGVERTREPLRVIPDYNSFSSKGATVVSKSHSQTSNDGPPCLPRFVHNFSFYHFLSCFNRKLAICHSLPSQNYGA